MNNNLLNILEDISSNPLKNYTLDEFSIVNRNISAPKDMKVGVRISLLSGENIIITITFNTSIIFSTWSADGCVDSW